MSINICRGRKITVTKPLLDLFHRNTIRKHQTCTGMTEIVEPDMSQSICLKQLREALCNIV